jgi:hypothetical protein
MRKLRGPLSSFSSFALLAAARARADGDFVVVQAYPSTPAEGPASAQRAVIWRHSASLLLLDARRRCRR